MIVQHQYQVFLSHNSADKAAVELIARRLSEEAGLEPFLDSWHLVPGEPWQEGLERALDVSGACAVFLGPTGLGTWDNEAMRAALDIRAEDPVFGVIPVLLPGATLPERGRLPRFLARLKWVDFRAGLDDAQAFHELISGILGVAPGPSDLPDAEAVCPFRGLEVFEEEHAEFFFGREALTQQLVEQLRADRFLAVLGPSGSGKSSLVRAGLVTRIRHGALSGSAEWPVIVLKPGPHPLDTLASRLLPLLGAGADPLAARQTLLDTLGRDERGLHVTVETALATMGDSWRVPLVIDQFEEVFTLCHDDAERQRFIATLLYASSIPGGQTFAVITMRADFLGKCAVYPDLAARLKGLELVGPMDAADLRRAMVGPAEKVGLRYEKGLVESILEDLGDEPGGLPLLQHTLLELWERRRGGWLTTDAYQTIGGVRGALAQRADAVYDQLPSVQQVAARRVLLRLTQPGEGTEDTRRRAPLSELLPASDGAADVEAAVRALADGRLLTTSTDERGAEIVDVAHEALIRGWPRLQRWIDENRAALRTQRRLTEAANEWATNTRDASYLYRGARLAEAQEWAAHTSDLNELERTFLNASVSAAESERTAAQRRMRQVLGGLVIGLVAVSVFAGIAVWFWRAAETSDRLNRARFLASEGQNVADEKPLLGLRLALEGLALAPRENTDARLALVSVIREIAKNGHLLKLGNDIEQVYPSPDGSLFILDHAQSPGEVRRTVDGRLITTLSGRVSNVQFSPHATTTVFVVFYNDAPAEVRRTTDGARVPLTGTIRKVLFSPNPTTPVFVVSYDDISGEVRRTTDGMLVQTLTDKVHEVFFGTNPSVAAFVVDYSQAPAELRRTADGSLITALLDEVSVVYFSPDAAATAFVVGYVGQIGELRRTADGTLITSLSDEVRAVAFRPDTAATAFAVNYYNESASELRLTTNGKIIATLPAEAEQITFSTDIAATAFVVSYGERNGELRRAADGELITVLPDIIKQVTFSPDAAATYFVVNYREQAGELRRTVDGMGVPLSGGVTQVAFSPDPAAAYFETHYIEGPGELRRSADATLVPLARVPGGITHVFFSPDVAMTTFVVDYFEGPGELRRSADNTLVVTLTADVEQVFFSPVASAASFIVAYRNAPGELRRISDGAAVPLTGAVSDVFFSPDKEATAFVVMYHDGRSELWDRHGEPRPLTKLGLGRMGHVFDSQIQRLVFWYTTGQAYLVDVGWLRAMHGDPDALSEQELVKLACMMPLTSGLFDEKDLASYLDGKPPESCR